MYSRIALYTKSISYVVVSYHIIIYTQLNRFMFELLLSTLQLFSCKINPRIKSRLY